MTLTLKAYSWRAATTSLAAAAAVLHPMSALAALLAVHVARRIPDAEAGVQALLAHGQLSGLGTHERIAHGTDRKDGNDEKSRIPHCVFLRPSRKVSVT